ncbi:MAG: GNAT family protein [SAR202 cluster bacterium]|jgi:RimJ/RimL family protein N-acetyltransferase|nr:GNAT family protein [SAR202 cluster bacterium]MDP6713997.1 GNAT family protein [SAR202 cluster bacterium]
MSLSKLLYGPSIRLTALTRDDVPTMIRWHHDSEFARLFDSNPAYPKTEDMLNQWLDRRQKASDAFIFAIRLLDDDGLLGVVEIDGIEWTNQVGWMSIGLGDSPNWGKGYGNEATRLVLGFAFNELNLHRVQLTVFDYNQRAINMYEKLGFQREGVYREFLQRDGRRFDMYLYGLLRHEWDAREKGRGSSGL